MTKMQLVGFRCPRRLLMKIDKEARSKNSTRSGVILDRLFAAYGEPRADNEAFAAVIERLSERVIVLENQRAI